MGKRELSFFKLLKTELEKKFKDEHDSCSLEITKWRQKEIVQFQEMMEQKVNDRISEKWFYTHIKNENNTKLPRIDTLNLLCRFVNYTDWDDFLLKNGNHTEIKNERKAIPVFSGKQKRGILISLIFVLFVFAVILFTNVDILAQPKYSFSFVDSDTGEPLENTDIEITVIHADQSSELINCKGNSGFEYETNKEKIEFIVKAAYYKTDTIIRILNTKRKNEIIKLKSDDYALMIHIFSSSKINDWQKRREQLDEMIAENARIYQVDFQFESRGIEIYNKPDFINKMTMPINSLKNIKIIETQYVDNKIYMMRFTQDSN